MARAKCAIRRRSAVGLAGFVGLAAVLAGLSGRSLLAQTQQSDLLSESRIRDVVLGRVEVTAAERELLDLNGDAQLDVGDLVTYFRMTSTTPKALFSSFTSAASEGVGSAQVTVLFSRAFTGTLHYSVGEASTASSGVDFSALPGTVEVNGTDARIAVPILDDTDIEHIESIDLRLEEGAGYSIGSPSNDTLFVDDNDAAWQGMMNEDGASRGFTLEIRRTGATAQGVLRGDATGVIPPSTPPEAGWPVQSIVLTDTHFEAHIENVPVPQERTARLGAGFTRSFDLVGNASQDDPVPFGQTEIWGELTERLVPDSSAFQHLTRTVTGRFFLSRARGRTNVPEPSLESNP